MGVCKSKIGGLTKVYHSLAVIVENLIIAGGTYGSYVSLVAFFAFTGIEVARYHEDCVRRYIEDKFF